MNVEDESIAALLQQANALKPRRIPFETKSIAGVANVIACASGKGGVGKSTTTVALAYALKSTGVRVGILDADIHGPNIACLMQAKVDQAKHDILDPVLVDGIATQSIAYWVKADVALAWRGPMVTKALLQMAYQTRWPELDILLLDMPPETGDIALSIAKRLPLCAAFLVATSNPSALCDVARAQSLFQTCKIPLLGVVDNMSAMRCEACGHQPDQGIASAVSHWADARKLPFLATIPFSPALHSGRNLGTNTAGGLLRQAYAVLLKSVVQQLQTLPRDYSGHFGAVQVNNQGE